MSVFDSMRRILGPSFPGFPSPAYGAATPDAETYSDGDDFSHIELSQVRMTPPSTRAATPDAEIYNYDDDFIHIGLSQLCMIPPLTRAASTASDASSEGDIDLARSTVSLTSSTVSLTLSSCKFQVEHGRTYHGRKVIDHQYPLPNDATEQTRLALQHCAVHLTLSGRLFLAPLENPDEILDVGTGLGVWCVQVARAYPSSRIIGVDISPIQLDRIPLNIFFEMFDAEQPWTYPDDRFNLIRTQNMHGLALRDWLAFYDNAFAKLAHGGWVENHEFDFVPRYYDDHIPCDSFFLEWTQVFESGLQQQGMTSRCHPEIVKSQMERAGFVETQVHTFRVPIGRWPADENLKEIGKLHLHAILEGLSGLSARIFKGVLRWNPEALDVFLAFVRRELESKHVHSYMLLHVFLGQKPPKQQKQSS